jgi:hypothetical protein
MESRINCLLSIFAGDSAYTLVVSNERGVGGSVPTVSYPSWKELSSWLKACGIADDAVAKAKGELDTQGTTDIHEQELTHEQLGYLGTPVAFAS